MSAPPARRAESRRIPIVDYLALEPEPHLVAKSCRSCGARFFDRRNACAACGSVAGFDEVALAGDGVLTAFTIISHAAEGVPVPFATGIVELEGTIVRGNLVHVEPDPGHVRLGMRMRLVTEPIATDADGVEAVRYAFEPAEGEDPR